MSFDTLSFSLASAVANAGTVTVGYPTGRSKGDYDWSSGKHKLTVNGNPYDAPKDFTVTFNANASNITVTNGSGSSWPQNAVCRILLDRPGTNGFDRVIPADKTKVRMVDTALYLLDLGSPSAAVSNGIAASQSVTVSTTPLAVLNGSLAASGVVALDAPRNIVAAWTGTAVLTVTGKTEHGNTIVESSASGTSFTGKKAFASVTSASFSANVTGATIGTGDVLGLPVAVQKAGQVLAEFKDGALLPGASGRVFLSRTVIDASAEASYYVVSPVAGTIAKITAVTDSAILTADGTITAKIATVAVTNGVVTMPVSGAAAGNVASATPTAANTVAAGGAIELVVSGAGAAGTGPRVEIVVEIAVAAADQLNGTFVAADNSKATATTGDVRGTYLPATANNGALGIKLLVALTDADNKGVPQYAG